MESRVGSVIVWVIAGVFWIAVALCFKSLWLLPILALFYVLDWATGGVLSRRPENEQ